MTVTLNIQNDAELRAYIKDCIKGQVLAIVREDFIKSISDEVERKIKAHQSDYMDKLLKSAAVTAVTNILYKEYKITTWNRDFISPYIHDSLDNYLKGMNIRSLVDQAAKLKIQELIK